MSYTQEELWESVAYAMPPIGVAHAKGVNFNLASLIDDALLKLLLDVRKGSKQEKYGPTGQHISRLHSAYEDLHGETGSFNFRK
jgi:hypothetical protein